MTAIATDDFTNTNDTFCVLFPNFINALHIHWKKWFIEFTQFF